MIHSVFRKLIPWIGFLILIACFVIFTKIALYFIVSVFIYLICQPITQFLQKQIFKKIKNAEFISNLSAFVILLSILGGIGLAVIPSLYSHINLIVTNRSHITPFVLKSFPLLEEFTQTYISSKELTLQLNGQIDRIINQISISALIGNSISVLSSILSGAFCIMVITFFIFKDRRLVLQIIDVFSPDQYHTEVLQSIRKSRSILGKYYLSLLIDMLVVSILTFVLLSLFGFNNALIISIFAGLFNAIPYIGPLITISFALLLSVNHAFILNDPALVAPQFLIAFFSLLSVYLFDAAYLQPKLFSKSIQAHPLEVFTIIIMAGSLGGVLGMMLAIPVYSLIRVVSKEFLSHIEFFNALSKNIK